MSNSGSNPAPTGGESELALPVAAIVCLAVGGYVVLIVIIVVVRYFLVSRGICECGSWCAKTDEEAQSCGCCAELAECCNCCKSPNMTACLDSICPNRKRMGCIELLLCQCCGTSGAEGMCACGLCRACLLCSCVPDCPPCPRPSDHPTITCLCLTIHINMSRDRSCDPSSVKSSLSQSYTSKVTNNPEHVSSRNNNIPSFTDLNKRTVPGTGDSSGLHSVSQHLHSQLSAQSHTQLLSLFQTKSSAFPQDLPTEAFPDDLHGNRTTSSPRNLLSTSTAQGCFQPELSDTDTIRYLQSAQHSRLPHSTVSFPQRAPSTESSTQTPRQFPIRRITLRSIPKRKLKNARDRFTPRVLKVARPLRKSAINSRIVQNSVWTSRKVLDRDETIRQWTNQSH